MLVKCTTQNWSGELPCRVKDSLQCGGVRCAEEEVTHTHTHIHTHSLSLRTITDHTAAVHKEMSQLCDGVQCRLTARIGGSAKGEILAVQLGKEQTD